MCLGLCATCLVGNLHRAVCRRNVPVRWRDAPVQGRPTTKPADPTRVFLRDVFSSKSAAPVLEGSGATQASFQRFSPQNSKGISTPTSKVSKTKVKFCVSWFETMHCWKGLDHFKRNPCSLCSNFEFLKPCCLRSETWFWLYIHNKGNAKNEHDFV